MSGLSTLSLHIMMPGRPARLSGSSMTHDIAAAQAGTDMNASDRLATALHDLLSGLAGLARAGLARAMITRYSDAASIVSAPISVPFSVAFSGLIPALNPVWQAKVWQVQKTTAKLGVKQAVKQAIYWRPSVLL